MFPGREWVHRELVRHGCSKNFSWHKDHPPAGPHHDTLLAAAIFSLVFPYSFFLFASSTFPLPSCPFFLCAIFPPFSLFLSLLFQGSVKSPWRRKRGLEFFSFVRCIASG